MLSLASTSLMSDKCITSYMFSMQNYPNTVSVEMSKTWKNIDFPPDIGEQRYFKIIKVTNTFIVRVII